MARPGSSGDPYYTVPQAAGGGTPQTDVTDRAAREAGRVSIQAGQHVDLGAQADGEAIGNGTVIAILKRIRTLLGQVVGGTTSGGLSTHKLISAASTNATSVKGSAGQIYWIFASNLNAAARYLKLYDKATVPVVGTDTPKLTLQIPPGSAFTVQIPKGVEFVNGIALALTTGAADADNAGVAAGEQIVNTGYK